MKKWVMPLLLTLTGLLPAATPDRLKVGVSIPPQASLVRRIAGSAVEIGIMVPDGKSPHDYSPTPVQVREAAASDVYFMLGCMPFEQRLTAKLKDNSHARFVNVSAGVEFIRSTEKCAHHHDGDKDDDHDHGGAAGDDPHIWLDPVNLKIMARNMTVVLSELMPARAAEFKANEQALQNEIDAIDRKLTTRLAPFKGRTIYVYHPAFGYFCRHYGLIQAAIEAGGKEPTPKRIMELIADARRDHVKAILVQQQFNSRSAARIADAINGTVIPVDILAPDALALIETIATRIADGLDEKSSIKN